MDFRLSAEQEALRESVRGFARVVVAPTIAEHYEQDSPVASMTRLSGLAERAFTRRFARATGMSPMEYPTRSRGPP